MDCGCRAPTHSFTLFGHGVGDYSPLYQWIVDAVPRLTPSLLFEEFGHGVGDYYPLYQWIVDVVPRLTPSLYLGTAWVIIPLYTNRLWMPCPDSLLHSIWARRG